MQHKFWHVNFNAPGGEGREAEEAEEEAPRGPVQAEKIIQTDWSLDWRSLQAEPPPGCLSNQQRSIEGVVGIRRRSGLHQQEVCREAYQAAYLKGEQGGEYRPVKSEKMDGSKRWLEFKRRPSPAEAGAEGRTTGVTGDAKPAWKSEGRGRMNRTKIRPEGCARTGWKNPGMGKIPGSGACAEMVMGPYSCPEEAVRKGTTEYWVIEKKDVPCRSKSSAVSRTRGQARSTFCLAPEQKGNKKEEIVGKVQKTRTKKGTQTRQGLRAEWEGQYEMYWTFSDPQG